MPQVVRGQPAQHAQEYLEKYKDAKDCPLLFGNLANEIDDRVKSFAIDYSHYGRILYSKYIQFKSVDKMCTELNRERAQFYRDHHKALVLFDAYIVETSEHIIPMEGAIPNATSNPVSQ